MWGTIVNTAAIVVCGCLGILLRHHLKENLQEILHQAASLAVVFVGIQSGLSRLLLPEANPVLFIVSLALGGLVGELAGIEKGLARLGTWLQDKFSGNPEMQNLSAPFVSASILFCAGTMSVLGSFQSGVEGDNTILFTKSLIDGIISIPLAATGGFGVVFAAGTVFVYQGLLTALAMFVSPWVTADIIREIGIIGGVLITAIGLNMLGLTKIRVGNLVPALLVPVIYYGVLGLFA